MRIVVDISGHGLGHAGQLIPVLRQLKQLHPKLRLTLRTLVPDRIFLERLGFAYERDDPPADVTLCMKGPTEPDVGASVAAYEVLHQDWEAIVALEARRLDAAKADLLLSNIAYTSLAAAEKIGLKALALSSLNWLDVYEAFCMAAPSFARVRGEILSAYASAALFVQATPHTPMEALTNRHSIGPIAARGVDQRARIDRLLGLGHGDRLVTVNFGGIPGVFPIADVPLIPGIKWILPEGLTGTRSDIVLFEELGIPLIDLIASSDLVVAKPGYGMFAEIIGAGKRLIYTERTDWPETPYLTGWASSYGAAAALGKGGQDMSAFAEIVIALLRQPQPDSPVLSGANEAAELIATMLT